MQPASFIIELESGECAQMTIHNIVLSTDVQRFSIRCVYVILCVDQIMF